MVTTVSAVGRVNLDNGVHMVGLSTDQKPLLSLPDDPSLVLPNGSTFLELDTGKVYKYDLENSIWLHFVIATGGGEVVPPVDPNKVYLYDEGDERTDATGGWMFAGKSGATNPVFDKSDNRIQLIITPEYPNSVSGFAFVRTGRKIDLTGIRKIIVRLSDMSTGINKLTVAYRLSISNNETIIDLSNTVKYSEGSGIRDSVELDVSDFEGKYYVVMGGQNNSGGTYSPITHALWLEK